MVNPVNESGTVWTVFASGDIVLGDDVCGYMGLNLYGWTVFAVRCVQLRITLGIYATRHTARGGTWVRMVAGW